MRRTEKVEGRLLVAPHAGPGHVGTGGELLVEEGGVVEDLVRNVAERLDSDVRVYWYRIEAENLDSVHDHNLYACVERSR